ncbi:SIR2 family protein [Exiguobacterium sp.]|uniref:SIR2 family protein n=1 Tax=Exiguobacterium sp. TaxID=44751 RepID=UPI0028A2CF2D|nr:SIR2 family protein [Exiguobacterium sp.]
MNDNFIKTSILKIKEASKNNKLIVFVGAGVSANSGIPAWGRLIQEMAYDIGYSEENISSDLYLKIPQYYFNERGEKEYYDKLNKIFLSKKFKLNPIHNEIFKLNPAHLITTNYDTLLEEASIEQGEFFHTVKRNVDLPYGNFKKTIIKMHGDFENKNIVLKEDDYLNYSTDFALIESYIKSLVSTNTVLFIGYSVNDPNFNLVFQWVKNILRNHFQPAYLIESNKEYSRIEHSYYKNRGINILYSNEIENIKKNNAFDSTNERGNQLYDMLSYFNSLDEFENMSDLERVYKTIEIYENLNFIMPDQIAKSFECSRILYDIYGNKHLTIFNEDNDLFRVFSKAEIYKGNEKKIFEKIINILRKANIKGVSNNNNPIYVINSSDEYIYEITKNIITADSFVNTSTNTNFNSLIENDNFNESLKQAFEFNNNGNHQDAYNFYKAISLKAFQDKEYFVYYISEFNRKHVGKILTIRDSKISEQINNEIKLIDLKSIYYNLPFRERESLKYLEDINDFNLIYRTQNKLNSEVNDIKNTKRTIEDGGLSFSSAVNRIYHIINNVWMFIETNYFCINNYTEVRNLYVSFLNGVFDSYSTQRKQKKNTLEFPIQKIETLDLFEIYVMVIKLRTNEVENLLRDNQIDELEISRDAFEYLIQLLNHLISNNKKYNNSDMNNRNEVQLSNLLVVLSKVNMDKNKSKSILESILFLINRKSTINNFKYINLFLVSVANKGLIEQDSILKFINKYLEMASNNPYNFSFEHNSLLITLTAILNENSDIKLEKKVITSYINRIQDLIEENEIDEAVELFNRNIIHIVPIINDIQKVTILDFIEKLIEKIREKGISLSESDMYFYQIVTIHKHIDFVEDINVSIIENTLQKIQKQNPNERSFPDPIDENLQIITNLYRNNCLNKDLVESNIVTMKNRCEYFDIHFLNEDVELTDISLISSLSEEEFNKIINNTTFKNKIYNLLEKEVFDENHKKFLNDFYKRKQNF